MLIFFEIALSLNVRENSEANLTSKNLEGEVHLDLAKWCVRCIGVIMPVVLNCGIDGVL